jgi:hypothetical protein
MVKRMDITGPFRESPQGAFVFAEEYDKLIAVLVAICERGDTDHSAKSMYWLAANALAARGFNSSYLASINGKVK